MIFRRRPGYGFAVAVIAAIAACTSTTAERTAGSQSPGEPAGMYRLSEDQYRNSIASIFGPDITLGGYFEPLSRRSHGLVAPGAYQIAVSPAGAEQYARMAHNIASQVVDENHRAALVVCTPASATLPDERCAAQFLSRVGLLLFRRPLSRADVQQQVILADTATRTAGSFYAGLASSLENMLSSPRFLFQMDFSEPDPNHAGLRRLDAYSKASRLSFFLWNTSPDKELLDAAADGDLHTPAGLEKQVDRLMSSPRMEGGLRAFFSDMLQLNTAADVSKDTIIYPQFILDVRNDMVEQTLRTITQLLWTERGDYRDLFTTRRTFMSRALGPIYGIPVRQESGWMPYEFSEDSPRAGILTQITFLSVYSHDGRSSPTIRGLGMRELLLCQPVPDPPGNVDFTAFEQNKAQLKTARERLTAHRSNPVCAGCHKITDPIGLALENFDGIGMYRVSENGARIDPSATINGTDVKDAVGLGQFVHNQPAATSCLVNRLVEYGTRQPPTENDPAWVSGLNDRFAAAGYRLPDLLRVMATSDAFFRIPEAHSNAY